MLKRLIFIKIIVEIAKYLIIFDDILVSVEKM